MTKRVTLIPIYGRDYTSQASVRVAFETNKDFEISDIFDKYDGKAVNREQLIEAGYDEVNVRYSKLRRIMTIQVNPQ